MDCVCRPHGWHRGPGDVWLPKFKNMNFIFTFMAIVAMIVSTKPVLSVQQGLLNTPPILYVPERNWRISEAEQVGQIIARIRANDAENDDLVFGLEPHFNSNYAPKDSDDNGSDNLPFRIDPVAGIVYLNESLIGRGGENFFLYITVSDGQLTAKNEVFVNILRKNDNSNAAPPSISSVPNISQFLPVFDQLPGVQSIRNQRPNRLPPKNFPSNFGAFNGGIFGNNNYNSGNISNPLDILNNYNPNQQFPIWPINNQPSIEQSNSDETTTNSQENQQSITTQSTRTKLTPINNTADINKGKNSTISLPPIHQDGVSVGVGVGVDVNNSAMNKTLENHSANYSIRTLAVPLAIAVFGLFAAVAIIFGFLYRKRLCAISKTLKKKSKEEMAKKSKQSNLSSNLTEDSRNSMVMQHWNGPMAYGNRYVPWEREQQMMLNSMATSQLSTSALNGVNMSATNGTDTMNGLANFGDNVHSSGGALGKANDINGSQRKYDRWEFPRHRLKFFNILGEGAFGQVWRCEASDIDGFDGITTVAVKTLKENAADIEKKDLISELEVMKSLEPHRNVVRMLGCCTDKDPIFVIIEYMNKGKLQTFLRNSRTERHYGNTHGKSNILTSGDLTSFMYQVAKGMDYLTSRGIIHRDLAARNVLISDDHVCKVADFGFARDVITSKIYERKSEGKLPIRWMATESLYDNIFSVKSDVWSFGILMWEIVTLGSTPYPGISAADVMHKVRDGYRLEKPEHCRRELYNIMYYCWAGDANERPNFSELVLMLDKLLHSEMDYIELERFPDHNYYNIVSLSGEKL